jgi:ferritin-like metal-binding protein YciE
MDGREHSQQIVKYLTDAHSIELQALAQMRRAPRVASDAHLRELFAEHEGETRSHERLVRELLLARGAQPSRLKDLAGRVGGWG